MMLFKLSFRNLKKSMRDYMIYFATLILGVAIFYVFNALEKQTVMLKVSASTRDIVKLMNGTMSGVSVFVAFVLGFLIVYASNFLMKRRKKEFAVYMLLGMSKRNISFILLIETLTIGVISLFAGLVFGIGVSQGMSIVVANMFEADMTRFSFIISGQAIIKTICCFLIMYVVVIIMDTFVVGKTKLINLINAGKKKEKNVAKNPVICLMIFVAGVLVLGSAYYSVTAGRENLVNTNQVIMQIAKGAVSTLVIFWSLSGILIWLSKKNKRFYYRSLNAFTVKELGNRINTTVFSGTIICLMLFLTICILSTAMSVKDAMNKNLKNMVTMDINLYMSDEGKGSLSDILKNTKTDMSMFKDEVWVNSYKGRLTVYDMAKDYIDSMQMESSIKDYYKGMHEEFVRISDYNKIAKAYGIEQYSLNSDEYIVVADYDTMIEIRNGGLKNSPVIKLGEKEYKPKYKECRDGFIMMSSNHINFGFILIPDSADITKLKPDRYYFAANYNASDDAEYEKIEKYVTGKEFSDKLISNNKNGVEINGITKKTLYESSVGITAMMVFVGVYLGFVFMISGAAILALKELSEAADNKEKYEILRKIGVDKKDLSKSLFAQCAVFFGIPLLVAVIHSIFGIQVCVYLMGTFGKTGVIYSIIVTAAMIMAIYGVYFLITYYCSKKIIES